GYVLRRRFRKEADRYYCFQKETETIDENDPYADRLAISDDLGEYDFNKYTFRIMTYTETLNEYFLSEDSADVIEAAIYQRNRKVEERFNCKIAVVFDGDDATAMDYIVRNCTSGEDAYDMGSTQAIYTGGLIPNQYFKNWYDLPNVNFDKPWWSDSNKELLTYNDVCFMALGDLSLSAMYTTYCVYYNKRLGADYDMPDIYELVNNGEWTIDKITELSKDIYVDMNMDGQVDLESDLFGYVSDSASNMNAYLWAFDNPVYRKNGDGELELVFKSDKLWDLTTKLCDVFNIYSGIAQCKFTGNTPTAIFSEGRAVFANGFIQHAIKYYREMEDDYAILPYPKWDEAQKNYYTMADGAHQALTVPTTINDPERVSTIIEALCAETYKIVFPAYYDVALKVKGTRDEESIKMLDQIVDSCVFDFGYLFDGFKGYSFILQNQIIRNNKNIESTVERYERSANKWYASIIEAFENYEG
ncbi:MAG: hypothetical protein J6S76_04915, partial [Clostridia bacterium]|nr:hypothetical protein [Clostridia bacterium]